MQEAATGLIGDKKREGMEVGERNDYGLSIWGEDNFFIKGDKVCIKHGMQPALFDITAEIRSRGYKGPLLLRFPHLIRKQISTLFDTFETARREFGYRGNFRAVFPLKVNQHPGFVESLMEVSNGFNYGLEAGS